ncbi:MAG TPA: hypothetical protein VHI10_12110 [Mycobacterium sp.]|nr:hypothetical protein [Mycobacterium sp.]
MDAVLGLSVTPSAVGLVLVEGQDADGATMDRDAFLPGRRSNPLQTSERAAEAVVRTEALAATRGHRLHSIGVTWSDDADTEASLLLKSLTESGFDNVVPVRLPEATEALAWGIAEVIGREITAVCVIEPETVIALIVHVGEGAVQTAVNHSIDTEESLARWLSGVFSRADWQPEALVVVGSGGDLDALMPRLEDILAVPVFAPAEAELALARGAALASAHNNAFVFDDAAGLASERSTHSRRWPAEAGPLALLAAGAVTFVVSVSVAVSLQVAPEKDSGPTETRTAAKTSPEAAAVAEPAPSVLPQATPAPSGVTPLAPPPEAPPVEVAPPPVGPPVSAVDVPAAPEAPAVEGLPPAEPVAALPPEAPVLPAPASPVAALPPESQAPGLVPAVPTPVPERRPGILRRLKDRLSGAGNDEVQQAPAPIPPPPGAPPEMAAAPPPELQAAPPPPPPPEVPPPPPPPPEVLAAPPPEAPPAPPPVLPPA